MPVRVLLLAGVLLASAPAARADDFFETKVRPVLAERCFKCHSAKQQKGGIRLDSAEFLHAPPDGSGSLVIAGKPDDSRLIKVVRQTGDVKMPPGGKLPVDEVRALEQWVKAGAEWPVQEAAKPGGPEHWAFKPVRPPAVPAVKGTGWPASPLDNFVLAKLEAGGLKPSPASDRRTLIRRVYYDLTGLPPSAEEVKVFLKDEAPDAYEKVVDRLLASPRFGERWGRHWLDLARYSDAKGSIDGEDSRYPFAYTYRDWVVKAFNDDLPYDQFLIKQIAADHLTRIESHPDLAALGFLTLGRKFENSEPDIIDDRLDVLFRGTQGLSIGCARCHDHKYDPIPIKDYYSLYGVFAGTQETDVQLISTIEDRAKYQAYAAELRARVRSFGKFAEAERKRVFGNYRQQADRYLLAAQAGGGEPKEGRVRADGLNQVLVNRYREHLEATRGEHNPIFAPWHAFAKLKAEQYASEGKKLAKAFAANEDEKKPIHSLVAALFTGKPPADLADVAGRYGRLFTATARKWEKRVAAADRNDANRPKSLEDEDEEEIRQLLFEDGPLEVLNDDLLSAIGEEKSTKFNELQTRITDLQTGPDVPPHARVLEDPEEPAAQKVFIRGKPDQPGDDVPRQFLGVLAGKNRKPFTDGTGRLELARAIAGKENPLTARVWVNRVWAHLFGRGIVETASDFGRRSTPPTHPELLDYLANSLTETNWSTKQLIRQIVLSNTYRQASADRPDARKVDPGNRLLWRMNRKRLEVEALRDSLLAVGGNLDTTLGGRATSLDEQPLSPRRALYLTVDRGKLPGLFRAYDFANPDLHSPGRHETTVPQQALFLLNSPFTHAQARSVAKRADDAEPADDSAWVRAAYQVALGRDASAGEVTLGVKFLASAAALKTTGPQLVLPPWRYGHGKWNAEKKRLSGFTTLAHFQDDQWRAGPEYPDPKLDSLMLSAEGGHPGKNRDAVAVRRWIAPADGAVTVQSVLKHELPKDEKPGNADGVRGYIVAGGMVLAEADAFNKQAPANVEKLTVRTGDTLDFVVDPKSNDAFDSFSWRADITFTPAGKAGVEVGFSSAEDFRGPPPPSPPPLSPKEKFAQVLLMSNEFLFVD